MEKKKGFSLRSFTSFALVISTSIMSWSGFVLYIAPPGRIANWGTWKLMLFTKTHWQELHTIFSYVFFILVIVHLFFINWRAFLTYFKSKVFSGLNRKWELLTATFLSALIFIGVLFSWTPFGPVMAFGEKVKASWEGKFEAPPILHMETFTLTDLAVEFDSIAPALLMETLKENNIIVAGVEMRLKDIATENNITPSIIYDLLSAKFKKHQGAVTGEGTPGVGRFTVRSVAENSGKDIAVLLKILKDKGVDADAETPLRTIAEKLKITPREVQELLTKNL
jgi:hypothetical protein